MASTALLLDVGSVHRYEDEWVEPWTRDANILHIELRRWEWANLLAKVRGGLCDDLLMNVIRAWDIDSSNPKRATIIAAPSMNNMMWTHPLTAKQKRYSMRNGVGLRFCRHK